MNTILIFIWIYAAMIAMSFWEAYVEGRNAFEKKKYGWHLKIFGHSVPAYHFYVLWVMWPLLLTLPFIIYGWDSRVFGIILSAFLSGIMIEDFFWYVVNPEVKLKEFWSSFSDYYPWIKFRGKKIIPLYYVLMVIAAVIVWFFMWR